MHSVTLRSIFRQHPCSRGYPCSRSLTSANFEKMDDPSIQCLCYTSLIKQPLCLEPCCLERLDGFHYEGRCSHNAVLAIKPVLSLTLLATGLKTSQPWAQRLEERP